MQSSFTREKSAWLWMTLQLRPVESASCRYPLMNTFDDLLALIDRAGLRRL